MPAPRWRVVGERRAAAGEKEWEQQQHAHRHLRRDVGPCGLVLRRARASVWLSGQCQTSSHPDPAPRPRSWGGKASRWVALAAVVAGEGLALSTRAAVGLNYNARALRLVAKFSIGKQYAAQYAIRCAVPLAKPEVPPSICVAASLENFLVLVTWSPIFSRRPVCSPARLSASRLCVSRQREFSPLCEPSCPA